MLSNFLHSILKTNSYQILALPEDASGRKYFRVTKDVESFILKEYLKDKYDPKDFINITHILQKNNIKVPKIYNHDDNLGLMLIEDLGTQTVKDFIEAQNFDQESKLNIYKNIIDLLIHLQQIDSSILTKKHDLNVLLEGLSLFINFFPQYLNIDISEIEKTFFLNRFQNILENFNFSKDCFVHRDFHVENIMFKESAYSIIDYQDASVGSPIYDLVSLVEDARIDMNQYLADKIITYYCDKKQIKYSSIKDEYDLIAAQRNLRILGVFSYHMIRNNNDKYIKYIPRVLNYLKRDLSNPLLENIITWLSSKKIMI
jgi:aminoglycoside/choline kinase family phosphotransferase